MYSLYRFLDIFWSNLIYTVGMTSTIRSAYNDTPSHMANFRHLGLPSRFSTGFGMYLVRHLRLYVMPTVNSVTPLAHLRLKLKFHKPRRMVWLRPRANTDCMRCQSRGDNSSSHQTAWPQTCLASMRVARCTGALLPTPRLDMRTSVSLR